MRRQERGRYERRIRSLPRRPKERVIAWITLVPALVVAALGDPAAHIRAVLGAVAIWSVLALRARPGRIGPLVLLALALRASLWGVVPTLSDDVWRYLWEGRVWIAGFNPLVHAPDAPSLVALRDADWARVNHRDVSSVYPPLAQLWFVLLHRGGPLAFRVGASLADLATVVLLYRRSPRAAQLWALLPLPVLESAVSGHLESLGALALIAGLGGRAWAAWLGAMVKLLPGILLTALPRRRAVLWTLSAAACLGAFLAPAMDRGLGTYAEKWSYNGSLFPIFRLALGESGARAALVGIAGVVVAGILWRSRNPARITLWTMGAFALCSPTVHPWYTLWPLAAGLWCDVEAWTLLAVLVPVAYVVLDGFDAASWRWEEPIWTRWVIWAPVYAHLAREGWRRLTRPGPWPVD